jgi:hypothetical protein
MSGGISQRIVIGADTFPPDVNGAANFAHRLAVGLAERGHDVHVICPETSGGEPGQGLVGPAGGPTVHRLPSYATPPSASARLGGFAGRPPGCWTGSRPMWFTYSPISA